MMLGSSNVLGKSKVAQKCKEALVGDANVTVSTFCTVTCATCSKSTCSNWHNNQGCNGV